MRVALVVGLLVAGALALFGYWSWSLFGFEETREYESYQAAAADRVFERNWLPEFIPASATGIVVTNNYDVYTSHGEFRYDPADSDAFLARLAAPPGRECLVARFTAVTEGAASGGYQSHAYFRDGRVWMFAVDAANGHARFSARPMPDRALEEAAKSCEAAAPAE